MKIKILPSKACGSVMAPPSKSMAHRALICGALSEKSIIKNIAFSKDIEATLNCLESLGATIVRYGDMVEIGGLVIDKIKDGTVACCNESGSTLRFLLPLCMASGKRVTLTGAKRLFERPLCVYEDIAKKQGIEFERTDTGVTVCGKLKAGEYTVPGDVSSQFISGLLFALSLLQNDSKIVVSEPFESRSYVDLTTACLSDFGVEVESADNTFKLEGNSVFSNKEYTVEGDCSNDAFLDSFNYLSGDVCVLGLNPHTLQGDRVYNEIFEGLKNGEKQFDLSDCPDLAPVSFSMAAVYGGAVFTGTKRLRLKESDRAEVMREELAKFGIEVDIFENTVIVKEGSLKTPIFPLDSHNDHRIAMALTLLASVVGGCLERAEAVTKSYPDFYKQISNLGIDLYEID